MWVLCDIPQWEMVDAGSTASDRIESDEAIGEADTGDEAVSTADWISGPPK